MKKALLVFCLVMFCVIGLVGGENNNYLELPSEAVVINNSIDVAYIELPPGPIVNSHNTYT